MSRWLVLGSSAKKVDGSRYGLAYSPDNGEMPAAMLGVETEKGDYAFPVEASDQDRAPGTFLTKPLYQNYH